MEKLAAIVCVFLVMAGIASSLFAVEVADGWTCAYLMWAFTAASLVQIRVAEPVVDKLPVNLRLPWRLRQ